MTNFMIGRSVRKAGTGCIPRVFRPIAVCVLSWLLCAAANALDPSRHISQYAHQVWRVNDGAIDPTGEITQTADGYFWLGSPNGLMRFDGVKFVRYAPPGLDLPTRAFTFLLGARDGSLWIGTRTGFGRLKDGRFQWYSNPAQHIGVYDILEDHEGTIWVTRYSLPQGEGPLCRVEGDRLHCFGETDGIPVRYGLGLVEDKSGDLWFGSTVLCRWRRGSVNTYLTEIQKYSGTGDGIVDVAAGLSGEIWAAVDRAGPELGIRHFSAGKWGAYVIPGLDGTKVRSHTLFIDRNQSLWIGTEHEGIYRVRDGMAEHYGPADGLSGDAVEQFYEDHEGDIWVATDGGLDMFRDTSIVTYSMREGLSTAWPFSILALRDDSVWIGTDGAVDILKGVKHSSLTGNELSGFPVESLFQDSQGVIWLGVGGKLMAYEHGRLQRIKNISKGVITAISEDTNHNILAATLEGGLFRIEKGAVHEILPDSSDFRRTGFLVPDREGGVWIGGRTNVLRHYRAGRADTVLIKGLDSAATVFGLIVDNDNSLLIPTSSGLFSWNANSGQVLDQRNGLPCDTIFSAIRDDDGALWLYSQCGLLKITRSEFGRWRERSDSKLTVEVFDKSDGALPTAVANISQPITAKTSDGRLWFLSRRSAQTIDPRQIYRNPLPPPVHIEKVVADHNEYALGDRLRLPALTRDIEIDYAALSLAVPQKVHFRYELEGHDAGWQDVGTRRQAFYSNLAPGNYRFRLIACNNDGVWNEEGAALVFSVVPAWYQTIWFRAFFPAAVLLVLWMLLRLRLRQLAKRSEELALINRRLEAQIAERKQAENALRQAQADLARANRLSSMGELSASLAHEVKQPITAAITDASTCLRWLSRDHPDLEEARAAALRIVQDGKRAGEIVNQVRLLFKKDAPHRELVDLNEIIREMELLLHSEATQFSVSIRTELAADLPRVMGDRVQLQQVLMNLMMNSIDAMKDVGGTRRLAIRSQRGENGEALISVSDTGVGLPSGLEERIFDAFFTTKPHGTGMGLRVSRSIVESHGGRLWADGNSSRGAVFHIALPKQIEIHGRHLSPASKEGHHSPEK
jgi:signal transduction histidine kinase/ligand-binding sensor domain-containing protein